ncbi:MAG: hypothetical protein BWY69_01752 [Planctomycetes bacterium ADurb.Bin401]|nr:MAG: hypothetical protein BWY69_01752 [Planctomycetes bacterium ADurb.Bin401]
MPCSSAGVDNDSLRPCNFAPIIADTAKHDSIIPYIEAATETCCEGFGLLEDFLEHEVSVAIKLDGVERKLEEFEFLVDFNIIYGLCAKAFRRDCDHFIVGEVNDLRCVLDDCGGVGGDDVFVFAEA